VRQGGASGGTSSAARTAAASLRIASTAACAHCWSWKASAEELRDRTKRGAREDGAGESPNLPYTRWNPMISPLRGSTETHEIK